MIQIFVITAPLGERDPVASAEVLRAAVAKVQHSFPPLREAIIQAAEGVLELRLTVAGRDRWDLSAKARRIGSSMLWRLKIAAEEGTMELIRTVPNGQGLTKGLGRSIANYRPRGAEVRFDMTPEDPS